MFPILAFGMPAAPEWIFIAILALVLLGPKKLPELARGLGKHGAEALISRLHEAGVEGSGNTQFNGLAGAVLLGHADG